MTVRYGMYGFKTSLEGNPQMVCKKARVDKERKRLYYFRHSPKVANEEHAHPQKNKGRHDAKDYELRRAEFGTIVFEFDYDRLCEIIDRSIRGRLPIERYSGTTRMLTSSTRSGCIPIILLFRRNSSASFP